MKNKTLIDSLITIVGQDRVLTRDADLDRYSIDALTPFRSFGITHHFDQLADVVVIPHTVDHIIKIVGVANVNNTPVIPYGSGTGVMGAVMPLESGIILDTKDLNSILEISTEDRTVTVESGVIIGYLDMQLAQHRFSTGHDPYSQPIATIGGATVLLNKYGLDRCLSISTISFRPEVNPPDAPPNSFPSVDVIISIFPITLQ